MLQFCTYPNNHYVFIVAQHVTAVRGDMVMNEQGEEVLDERSCHIFTPDKVWSVRGSAADAQLRVTKEMMA